MPNPGYVPTDYTAFAIEQVLSRDWEFQYTAALPLVACIKDRELGYKKGFSVEGTKALVPIVHSGITGFTTGTAGIADNAQIPAAWPTFDGTEGFSQAAFEYTHMERSMVTTDSDRVIAKNGARGDIIDGKVKQLMYGFTNIQADWLSGTANGSRVALGGIDYAIATNNTYGGIDRTSAPNAYFRGIVDATGGTLGFSVVNNAFDQIKRNANEVGDISSPDLLLLTFVGGGVNLYGRFRELIAPSQRIVDQNFRAKYGFENFEYLGMKCVMETRGAAGQIKLLDTSKWVYGGYEIPKEHEPTRIPGSTAVERRFSWWGFIGCKQPRCQFRGPGFTG